MEPLFGCVAVLVVLAVTVAPVVALVLALRQRAELRRLAAALAEQGTQLAVLRRHVAAHGAGLAEAPPPAAAEPAGLRAAPPSLPVPEPAAPSAAFAAAERVGELAGPGGRAAAAPEPPRPSAPPPQAAATEAPAAGAAPRPPGPGLEERLGARLPVWLGGIALALAGAFLVKYSVDRGWLSPAVRVALGLLFGVALLALGEWTRARAGRISQALSAAGVADLYAVLLAGIRLYDLIPPLVGFVLMAANTAVAVLLSLRQGPMIALIGLVGGFATPALVATGERNAPGLMAYLFLLDAGLVAVTRRRRWPWLAPGALAASLGWVAAWLVGAFREGDGLALGVFLLASTALFAGAALRGGEAEGAEIESRRAGWMAAGAAGGALVLLAAVVDAGAYGAVEWGMFALLAGGCYALAWRRDELFGLAPLAAGVALVLLAKRGTEIGAADAPGYLATTAALGLGFAAAAWAALLRGVRPARWGTLAAAAHLLFPLVGYALARPHLEVPWAALALAWAALAVAAAVPVAGRRGRLEEGEEALAALAVAATFHASFALALALERAWLSVAFALEVPLLLALRRRLRVAALGPLALGAAGVAAARLLLNAEVLRYPIGELPVLNWLLWGYGVPAIALLAAAAIALGEGREGEARLLEAGATLFAFALVTLEVFHSFHRGGLPRLLADRSLLEWSAQAVAWLGLGLVLLEAGRRRGRAVFSLAGRVVVALGAAQSILVHGVVENPAWEPNPVGGTPVANLLLLAYGAPLALLLVAARRVEREGGRRLPLAARGCALALGFLLVSLEVRQLFRGSDLATGPASNAEQFAYSAAWVLYGTALLGIGLVRHSRALRFAALAVMLAAVLKVFLYDTRELEDLYRVFSFLGLGASLLLLAWLYQRFVFRAGEQP